MLQAKPVPENDIIEIGGMTRFGGVYNPEELQKGQEPMAEEPRSEKKEKGLRY